MKTFLENLKKELNKLNFSTEEINEIMSDHEEMIQSAMDDGLETSKITEKFGDPEQIAKDLLTDNTKPTKTSHDFELLKTFETKDIENFNIGLNYEDLSLETCDNEALEVYGKKIKMSDYDIEVKNKTFYLTRKKDKNLKSLSFSSSSKKFVIKFPKNLELMAVNLKATSTDIDITDLHTKTLDIKNVSGDIEISRLITEDFNIKNISGDVDLSDTNIKDILVSSVSGDLEIKNTTIENSLKVNSVSGDVEIEHTTTKELYFRTVSGDLEAKEYYPEYVTINSVTGDVDFKNKDKDKRIIMSFNKKFKKAR